MSNILSLRIRERERRISLTSCRTALRFKKTILKIDEDHNLIFSVFLVAYSIIYKTVCISNMVLKATLRSMIYWLTWNNLNRIFFQKVFIEKWTTEFFIIIISKPEPEFHCRWVICMLNIRSGIKHFQEKFAFV